MRDMSLAFSMLSRAAGGVDFLIDSQSRLYPLRTFRLLDDTAVAAQDIMKTPWHMMDGFFAAGFRSHYNSEALLISNDALSTLAGLARTTRLDTSRIESRFSSVRRMQLVRSLTHMQSLTTGISIFFLRRARIIERCSWVRVSEPLKALKDEPSASTGTTRGCGD